MPHTKLTITITFPVGSIPEVEIDRFRECIFSLFRLLGFWIESPGFILLDSFGFIHIEREDIEE